MTEGMPLYEAHVHDSLLDLILNEEFPAADESRWTPQINLILPAHRLRTSGRNHRHRRSDAPARNRSYHRRARSRAGRLGLAHPTFKQPDRPFIRAFIRPFIRAFIHLAHQHVLHICAVRKLRLRSDPRRLPLPSILKVLHENYVMWRSEERRVGK